MDDSLERPTFDSKPVIFEDGHEEDAQSSGDEDDGPDWTKLPSASLARPVIPKRGEKEFEPSTTGGSGLQRHVLDRARSAMFDALRATRTTSSKNVSYAVWHSDIARANVTVARGIHFPTMGHSVLRTPPGAYNTQKVQKRLELLPEEALYLLERGAMFCSRASSISIPSTHGVDDAEGVPMSVEEAFSEMIGKEDLTLEKYQVYAYLKRLGYVVTRARAPTASYPAPPPFPPSSKRPTSIFSQIFSHMRRVFSRIIIGSFEWWKPLPIIPWLHTNMNTFSLFKSLRFLSVGHEVPLHIESPSTSSPYEIFYNLYKPSTIYKKTAPPLPDFSVVVVNARESVMPSITELNTLFEGLPELPPPVPRRRLQHTEQKPAVVATPQPAPGRSIVQRMRSWLHFLPLAPTSPPPRRPNPFMMLKAGKKIVVVAVVDVGSISFFRFGQGAFTEWPMQ